MEVYGRGGCTLDDIKIRFLRGRTMERNRNNSSWICDRLEELLEEYRKIKEDTYDAGTYHAYDKVIDDLESILYN